MASDVQSGPRRYLLLVMAVALILLVPLMFLSVTLIGRLIEPPPGSTVNGWVILWVLLGLAVTGLVIGSMVMIARGTRQAQLEHEPPATREHRAS